MINSQDPHPWQELLADYVLGEVTPAEAEQVKQLLITHPELEREIFQLQETLALLPLALPESTPPADLGDKILRQARRKVSTQPLHPQRLLSLGLGTAILGMALGLGWMNYRLQQKLAIAQNHLAQYEEAISLLGQPHNRLLSLQGTKMIPAASGSLVVIPHSETIILTLQQVTPLPQGKIYRLWGVVAEKKVFCGEFQPNSQGQVLVKFPLDAQMSDPVGVIITIEPLPKTNYPTGATVMTGQFSL